MTESATDAPAEATRILGAAREAELTLRLTGGLAVAKLCDAASRPPLSRRYNDIDFVARSRDAAGVTALFGSIGYQPETEFNLLHGQRRLFFVDLERNYEADVFLDRIEMCHQLDLSDRLERCELTLAPSDLLLSKLQVIQTNDKDYLDMVALLTGLPLTEGDDIGIDLERVRQVCGNDWGWWKTATLVGARLRLFAAELDAHDPNLGPDVLNRIDALLEELEQMPKSRKWRLRARIGERVRWHEEPEDINHELEAM